MNIKPGQILLAIFGECNCRLPIQATSGFCTPSGERKPHTTAIWLLPFSDHAIYNLYAISNHSGTTMGGHYTAYCKSPVSGEWHAFNDSR